MEDNCIGHFLYGGQLSRELSKKQSYPRCNVPGAVDVWNGFFLFYLHFFIVLQYLSTI